MKLLTKALLEKLPALYSTEKVEDPMCVVKLFNPVGVGTWYIIEYDPVEELAFGYVELFEGELGYFSLKELKELRLPLGLKIERDMYFTPTRLSDVKSKNG